MRTERIADARDVIKSASQWASIRVRFSNCSNWAYEGIVKSDRDITDLHDNAIIEYFQHNKNINDGAYHALNCKLSTEERRRIADEFRRSKYALKTMAAHDPLELQVMDPYISTHWLTTSPALQFNLRGLTPFERCAAQCSWSEQLHLFVGAVVNDVMEIDNNNTEQE